MKIRKTELERVLRLAKSTISSNPIHPVLGCYCFTGTELVTFDGIRATQIPFKTDFTGGVPFLLLSVISRYQKEDIDICAMNNNKILLKCGKAKDELVLLPKESFLWELAPGEDGLTVPLNSKLLAQIKTLSVCADTNALHVNTNGVYIGKKGRSVYIAATNNYIIGIKKLHSLRPSGLDFQVMVPLPFIAMLSLLPDHNKTMLHFCENRLIAKDSVSGIILETKLIKFDNIPDCVVIFESVTTSVAITIPGIVVLERLCAINTKDVLKPIQFVFSNKILSLIANSELGQTKEVVSDDSDLDVELTYNGVDILSVFRANEIISLAFCENGVPGALLATSKDGFVFLINRLG